MKSSVLIVGGTGYLGVHLRVALHACYDIYFTGTQTGSDSNFYTIDFADERTFDCLKEAKFDIIIILASIISGLGKVDLNNPDFDVNVCCYRRFLQFVGDQRLTSKIIYISSMTVYGANNYVPVDEKGAVDPISVYGLSKSLAESVTSFFSKRNNVKSVIIRCPGLFGGNRTGGFVYNIIQKCFRQEDIHLNTSGLGYWECIEVNDFCNMLSAFMSRYQWENIADVFNFGYGEETDFVSTAYFVKATVGSRNAIFETGEKGYVKFFLSNTKLKNIIDVECNFKSSLTKYVGDLLGR